MKYIKLFIVAAMLVTAGMVTLAFVNAKTAFKPITTVAADKGFAVVELFTSEGCSSCPAADAVIAKMEKESTGKPVYILAYHVDYWNRLGWKDVFSSAEYSHRQSAYASWLKLSGVYTPQVVVNGTTEFVGSQEGTLRNLIRKDLGESAKAALSITDLKTANATATFNYNISGAAHSNLVMALVQKNAVTSVKRGENGGRTLSHVQIVTAFKNIPVSGDKGQANISLPKTFTSSGYELIAFLQNPQNGQILAATKAEFAAPITASN